MKKLMYVFVLFLFAAMACNQVETPKTTVLDHLTPYSGDPEYLNGQVKSLSHFAYWGVEEDGSYVKGESISKKDRDSIRLFYDFKVFYDENGLHQRTNYYGVDRKINYWETEIEDGMMVKSTWTKEDTSRYYFTYIYDEDNHWTEAKGYSAAADTLENIFKFITNEDGIITEYSIFDHDNNITAKRTYTLNEDKLTTSFKRFSPKDSLLREIVFSYNDQGLIIVEDHKDGLGETTWKIKSEYTSFDEMGNFLLEIAKDNRGLIFIVERIYEYY